MSDETLDRLTATSLLGIDTLWGGDVMNPSGTGRFIADSWFSDEPLPEAYTHPAAKAVRDSGGVAAEEPDRQAIDRYLGVVDVPGAIAGMTAAGKKLGGLRGAYFDGLGALLLGDVGSRAGDARTRRARLLRAVRPRLDGQAAGAVASGVEATARRRAARAGGASSRKTARSCSPPCDAWRRERRVPRSPSARSPTAFIAQFDAGTAKHPGAAPAPRICAACRAPT